MKLIKDLFDDLLYFWGFKKDNNSNLLIFLVHPRDKEDIFKKIPVLKKMPRFVLYLFETLMWPVTVSKISNQEGDLLGLVVSTPSSAKLMLKNRKMAKRKIKQALRLGYAKGGRIAALGALTASLTYGGKEVYDGKMAITTGHAYTVLNINKILNRVLKDFNKDAKDLKLAVVGAAGSIGSGSAYLAAKIGVKDLLLVDLMRKKDKIEALKQKLEKDFKGLKLQLTHSLKDLSDREVVIAATNHPDALIKSEHLKSGAVIIDDAQPSDVSKEVFEREDVLVLEGGAAKTPGVSINFPVGLCEKDDNFSCMAEGLLLLYERAMDKAFLGTIQYEHIDYIESLAKKYNFIPAKYQNYKEKCISDRKVEKVKALWNR